MDGFEGLVEAARAEANDPSLKVCIHPSDRSRC